MKLSDHVVTFANYLETSTDLRPSTRQRYVAEVERFLKKVGDPDVDAFNAGLILTWHSEFHRRHASPATVDQKKAALHRFFVFLERFCDMPQARRWGTALEDLRSPEGYVPRRKPYSLDMEAFQKMLDQVALRPGTGPRDVALLWFFWDAGVRNSEATGLTIPDLDLEQRQATVIGKGNKARTVYFTEATQAVLQAWVDARAGWSPSSNYVFCGAHGRRLTPQRIDQIVGYAARRAGLTREVWAHVFRHTGITRWVESREMEISDAATLAGHNDIRTTFRYFHPQETRLKDAYDRANEKKAV